TDLAALRNRRIEAELVVVAVQVVKVGRDDFALEVLPWAVADAVARIHRRLAACFLRAEVGVPGLAARAMALRQSLAILIRTFDAAEIGALAGSGAGDEERHFGRLRQLRRGGWRGRLLRLHGGCDERCKRRNGKCSSATH